MCLCALQFNGEKQETSAAAQNKLKREKAVDRERRRERKRERRERVGRERGVN